MPFTLACAQFAPDKAEVSKNLDRIAELCARASAEGADLVVFPEGAVTGYFLEGGVLEAAIAGEELVGELSKRLKGRLGKPLDAVVGFYERAGGNLYNSAAYLELGPNPTKLIHVYRKFFLPTYGVFDEERFVSRGTELGVFDTRFGRVGILICEDVWHSILSTLLSVRGAQLIVVPSASPARGFSRSEPDNHERYRRMLRAISEEHGIFTANVHLCGFEGGKGFVGGSMVTDPFGKLIAESPILEEHLLLAPIDFDLIEVARAQTPLLSDLQSAWENLVRLAKGCPEP